MRKFKFKLQSVLHVAQREEQRLTLELAQLQHEKSTEQAKMDSLKQSQHKTRAKLMLPTGSIIDLEKVEALRRHLEDLSQKIAEQTQVLARLEKAIDDKTQEVIEAMKKRKTLEKLQERERREHNLILSRLEEKMLDDLTTPRHAARAH